ncbi:MAG: hypothetical protein IT373_12660 [Polyangiaceae bacterium]|nr:hypothetical protein [Polyangiaceae bacterium]
MTVRVPGDAPLACEAKVLGEWARVECAGIAFVASRPTAVEVHDSSPEAAARAAMEGTIARLHYRFVEGAVLRASFSWGGEIFRYRAGWQAGSKKPAAIGAFGTGETRAAGAILRAYCACPHLPTETDLSAFGCTVDPAATVTAPTLPHGCMRIAPRCQEMLECITDEMRSYTVCDPDDVSSTHLPGHAGACLKACGGSEPPCPGGLECLETTTFDDSLQPVAGPHACQ